MSRLRVFASLLALGSLAALAAAWPDTYSGGWQLGLLAFLLILWLAAVWTARAIFAGTALLIALLISASLISFRANELWTLASTAMTLAVWMQSRILQIASSAGKADHEMLLIRNLAIYTLLVTGVSLLLGLLALNVHLQLSFFFAFIGAAALIFLASRLIIRLRQQAQ